MAEVKLHAYKLIGPAWHVGVEVYNKEYFFDGYTHPCDICIPWRTPRGFKGIWVCQTIGRWAGKKSEVTCLGSTTLSEAEVTEIIADMSHHQYTSGTGWSETNYSLLQHNCQDFARAFCARLGCKKVPWRYVLGRETLADELRWCRWVCTKTLSRPQVHAALQK
eukprot:TRINITY_DN56849_c0_g1_i1.p1 TRINITY_DN56849_c0_g1~~TRINITY_DN56849_c0_g1_i1.p1  ORF type:complete len:191 (-),score=12.06 TRINITY_DN56849_c0_g1_i1:40-531(-)